MNDNIKYTLQAIASNFAKLSEELEKENIELHTRLNVLENETTANREVLRDIAHKILERLDWLYKKLKLDIALTFYFY